MMDVSDGIGSDLMRLSDQSKVGFEINLESLPASQEILEVGRAKGWDLNDLMINGGEDYVLLLTVDPEKFERLSEGFLREFDRPLNSIGCGSFRTTVIFSISGNLA
jgi:thiamine-monophosphate kinase